MIDSQADGRIRALENSLKQSRARAEHEKPKGLKQGARLKVTVSGGVVEVWDYEIPVRTGKMPKTFDPETGELISPGRLPDVALDEHGNLISIDRKEEYKTRNGPRSRMQLRRLVLSNFDDGDRFITLTFRDGAVNDIKNVRECNKVFERFIKRLRRSFGDFRYVRVVEFQDKRGRGAVHYHCIMTLGYLHWKDLRDTWGAGDVDITPIKHVDNVGAYISKYMAKDLNDDRLAGLKAFATSQNLTRPITVYGKDAEEILDRIAGRKKIYSNSYESEYNGTIRYTEYNLNRE